MNVVRVNREPSRIPGAQMAHEFAALGGHEKPLATASYDLQLHVLAQVDNLVDLCLKSVDVSGNAIGRELADTLGP